MLSVLRAIVTIAIPDQNVTFLRGIETGIRTVDVGIKVGTPLTILGTIVFDDAGNICIEPELILKERLNYLLRLKDLVIEETKRRNFWLLIGLLGGAYVGRRCYKYVEKNGWVLPWNNKKGVMTEA